MNKIVELAKKTFLALQNPYQSIIKTYPLVIDEAKILLNKKKDVYYLGVKNTNVIPHSLVETLNSKGFILHTIDSSALGGRAIDTQLKNPITGQPMTGSSSGTALNVLYGINDLGIGTDGGGSVLAPALSVCLYGFISPLIEETKMVKFSKRSTDNIVFSPSIGFITREYAVLKTAIESLSVFPLNIKHNYINIRVLEDCINKITLNDSIIHIETTTINKDDDRKSLIPTLIKELKICDLVISFEGPIDYYGLGDTIFGHLSKETKIKQMQSGKGLIRVANMVNATTLVIPTGFCSGLVLLCESSPDKISKLMKVASMLQTDQTELIKNYFLNHNNYFLKGYQEE